jgi:hypothetical protein
MSGEIPLIPTRLKQKLGHEFSYPFGAAELSRALRAVPQYAQLEISFHESFLNWLSEKRPEPWRSGRHEREVWFHPAEPEIIIRDVG